MNRYPEHVFHYTTPAGLLGILRSRAIWAAQTGFLNDLTELRVATDIALAEIDRCAAEWQRKGPAWEFRRQGLQAMRQIAETPHPMVFVASLSRLEDDLSQWRGYCRGTGGYALAIPRALLQRVADANGCEFVECIYDPGEHQRLVLALVREFIANLEQVEPPAEQPADASAFWARRGVSTRRREQRDFYPEFYRSLWRLAARLKHPAFEHEAEWRLIAVLDGDTRAEIMLREGSQTLVPYVEIPITGERNLSKLPPDLCVDGDPNASLGIVVGPSADVHASRTAAELVLRRYIGEHCWTAESEVPYRD
ncbi:MAG TPA: DUF2971 domain-containing protein [Burkholderiaceae bacterium]|jgi:hypothetical protein|nr:DUF2971 domain-containing protein [Burkholderiaceae bacterium]